MNIPFNRLADRRICGTLILAMLLLWLAACTDRPGSSEIKTQVLPLLAEESVRDIIEIENLHKTNGYEAGGNRYTVDIAYDIVFKVSFAQLKREALPKKDVTKNMGQSMDGFVEGLTGLASGVALLGLGAIYGDFNVGDRFSKQDRLEFIKSEQGWVLATNPKSALW